MESIIKALEERLGRPALEARLEALRRETGGLLDEDALLSILADEEGLTSPSFVPLNALRPGAPVFARCTVEAVGPTREFRSPGGAGRVRKLSVSDGTASLALTLWDEETSVVERLSIAPGTRLRILSGVYRETPYGPEIHMGREGFIVVEGPAPPEAPPVPVIIGSLGASRGRVIVRGVLTSLSFSGRGRARSVLGRIFDGTGECGIDFSGAPPEQLVGLAAGVEVEVSGALVRPGERFPSLLCNAGTKVRIVR